eukprot:scaffold19434_cov114-Isochrysis_galbana.AAC.3
MAAGGCGATAGGAAGLGSDLRRLTLSEGGAGRGSFRAGRLREELAAAGRSSDARPAQSGAAGSPAVHRVAVASIPAADGEAARDKGGPELLTSAVRLPGGALPATGAGGSVDEEGRPPCREAAPPPRLMARQARLSGRRRRGAGGGSGAGGIREGAEDGGGNRGSLL